MHNNQRCPKRNDPGGTAVTYFHGGRPGMVRGQLVLPKIQKREPGKATPPPGKVHLTTDIRAAMICAVLNSPGLTGFVYEVAPIGAVTPDAECDLSNASFCCSSARIKRVAALSLEEVLAIRAMLAVWSIANG